MSNPSSSGSKTSTISEDVKQFTWCKGNFRFKISAIVTALFIALPIALRTIFSEPLV
jgi:hypothetical protein